MTEGLIYRVGPQSEGPFYVPDMWNNREGPQAKDPSKCLNWWELRRKSGQRGLLITGYKRLKKDSDRAITPAMEAVCVPAHLALPGSPQAKQLHHLHTQLSLGQSCRREKTLVSMCTGLLWSCPTLCDPVDCGLPGFSVRVGVLQARTLERPSRALYYLLP